MVEIEIGNVQLGEEESSPKLHCILLIPSGTNVSSPFDPIDVGVDEIMQNHPRIINKIIIKNHHLQPHLPPPDQSLPHPRHMCQQLQ